MGENIIYEELVSCDGSASFDASTNTLNWNPIKNPNVVSPIIQNGSSLSGWMSNIAQLVYRVRLDVEADGFDSCADNMNSGSSDTDTYDVNQSARLTFHKEALEGATGIPTAPQYAAYPVPEVRGSLYDITFMKKSDDWKNLTGAVFGLFEADGTTEVEWNGQHYTVTSVAGEVCKFRDLPFGTYVVKEMQPPPYYSAPADAAWTVTTCYTTNPGQLIRDSVPDDDNMPIVSIDSYGYIGYLSIPAIELELPVMSEWDYTRLAISPCRHSGSTETGELIIAGHNYDRHFGHLRNLGYGDLMTFTNMNGKTTPYYVSEVVTLEPTQMEELQSGDWDITLYTCTYGGSRRITVRFTKMSVEDMKGYALACH